jgi:hypothetical protein
VNAHTENPSLFGGLKVHFWYRFRVSVIYTLISCFRYAHVGLDLSNEGAAS